MEANFLACDWLFSSTNRQANNFMAFSDPTPKNLLYIISDQHNRDLLGCYGHPSVETPNIDRLAERGTRFTNAYTNCPICVPARASLATGQYVHQIGYWDNAFPYDGQIRSWGHHLREQGHQVDSIGKLHFSGNGIDHGFSREVEPLHVVDGIGDVLACIRQAPPIRDKRSEIYQASSGDSTYLQYDQRNTDNACQWIKTHQHDENPWVLFLSFVCPHPPYIAPSDLFNQYSIEQVKLLPQSAPEDWPDHTAIDRFRSFFAYDQPFTENEIQQLHLAYYAVCTYLDYQIGQVVKTLDQCGLTDSTRIIYTSDHGDSLGARGLYGKFTMYEESVAVPMIMAGPDIPVDTIVETPVSLVDSYPTIIEAVGANPTDDEISWTELAGESLWSIINSPSQNRTVFSEYHAVGSQDAVYMLRDLRYKYVHYVNERPQLFDLDNDPDECDDLSLCLDHRSVLSDFENRLAQYLDPIAINEQAHQAQQACIVDNGGEIAVRQRGAFDNSPVPGEKAAFRLH